MRHEKCGMLPTGGFESVRLKRVQGPVPAGAWGVPNLLIPSPKSEGHRGLKSRTPEWVTLNPITEGATALTQALLLTGAPGTGKTTIIREAIHATKEKPGGFYTQEIREGGARLGFEIVTLDGSRAVLAHVDIRGPQRVGKYGVDVACLDRVAIPTMRRAIQECSIVVVDEIGKMELLSSSFRDALTGSSEQRETAPGHHHASAAPVCRPDQARPQGPSACSYHESNRQLVLRRSDTMAPDLSCRVSQVTLDGLRKPVLSDRHMAPSAHNVVALAPGSAILSVLRAAPIVAPGSPTNGRSGNCRARHHP